ncbi:MAG: DUF1294 domain-containing protein [Rhizobacter sp.]
MIGHLAVTAFLVAYLFVAIHWGVPLWVSCLYIAASSGCLVLYAVDKSAAIAGRWRVPERTLIALALAGGWPGAVMGQHMFRHKSKKRSFQWALWSSAAINALAFVLLSAATFMPARS